MLPAILFTVLVVIQIAKSYILSGYICPTCPSAPDPASLISAIPSHGYTHVSVAFIVFNSDGTIVPEFDTKTFTLTKTMIQSLQSKGIKVFISIGGGAGSTLACNQDNNNAFINNFADGILNITEEYGFDGVDFDIEHRSGDYVLCADIISATIDRLYAAKLLVSMAPQMVNLYPGLNTVSAGFNELAPLVAMENSTVLQWIQVQMYNSWSSVETVSYAEQYTKDLAAGYYVTADGKRFNIKVPPSQLLLGYPSSTHAAGSGYINPSQLKTMYSTLKSSGYTIAGFMTWSIGWDQQNNWLFSNTLANLD